MKFKNVKKLITTLLITALAVGTLTGCASSGEEAATSGEENGEVTIIRAGTSGGPNPYITTDENNELDGYDIAVLRAVFERLPQYELEFELADATSAVLTGLNSGLYDIAVNNLGYREERAESYYYSYPYDKIKYVFIQRKDDAPLTSFQDASDRGYKIEVGAGNNITNALEQWNEENPDSQIELVYTESDLTVTFQHVEEGISDFRIDDLPIYTAYQEEYGFPGLDRHDISDEEAARISSNLCSYFLFPKDDAGAALREDVNAALKELREDGTLAELSEKYFGGDQVPDAEDFEATLN